MEWSFLPEAKVTDPDGITDTPTWQWASASTPSGSYSDISGATSATYTHDGSYNYLRVTAAYTDKGFGSKTLSKTQQVEPPSSIDSGYTLNFTANTANGYGCGNNEADICINIPRNKTPGKSIYYPKEMDYTKSGAPDRTPASGGISYSLDGPDADLFDIDPVKGILYANSSNGYGGKNSYSTTVTATDPSGRNGSVSIHATPSGSSNNPIVMGPDYITYPENGTWPIAKFDGRISGRNLNEDVGWIISVQPGGGDGDFFDIDDNGVLYFEQAPDHENPADENKDSTYSFSVHAYDQNPRGRNRPGEAWYNVTVKVVNAREDLEIDGPTSKEFPENSTDPVHTYTVIGATGTVTWSIAEGDSGLFTMNNGVLSFTNPPDYENPFDSSDAADDQNDYLFNIYVTDGNRSGKIEPIRIMVTNVNEPPAFPSTEDGRRTVSEDLGSNEDIGDPFEADDPDGDLLDYSLGGTDALSFDIDPYTGQLKTAAELDFETQTSYSLTVAVTDGRDAAGNTDDLADDTINVTITVTGANEAPAFKETGTVTREVVENTAKGQNVGAPVLAEDPERETIEYTLEGTDASSFTIDSTSGQIKTNIDDLDYETKDSYSVTVKASDGANSVTLPVTINVTDINETPTITGDLAPSHPENSTAEIGRYVATDEERDGITWSLKPAGDHSHFLISNAGGPLLCRGPKLRRSLGQWRQQGLRYHRPSYR